MFGIQECHADKKRWVSRFKQKFLRAKAETMKRQAVQVCAGSPGVLAGATLMLPAVAAEGI